MKPKREKVSPTVRERSAYRTSSDSMSASFASVERMENKGGSKRQIATSYLSPIVVNQILDG
jgi:hypothetical protein